MSLKDKLKRKQVTVDLILDQDKAERIAALGRELVQAQKAHATEGANVKAKKIARQIEELREQCADSTVRVTLEALPLSQWRQVLESNTTTDKNGAQRQRVEEIMRDAIPLMVKTTVPDTPVDELADVMMELSDGQISPLWYAVRDLNARLVDPKDALEAASNTLRNS